MYFIYRTITGIPSKEPQMVNTNKVTATIEELEIYYSRAFIGDQLVGIKIWKKIELGKSNWICSEC